MRLLLTLLFFSFFIFNKGLFFFLLTIARLIFITFKVEIYVNGALQSPHYALLEYTLVIHPRMHLKPVFKNVLKR